MHKSRKTEKKLSTKPIQAIIPVRNLKNNVFTRIDIRPSTAPPTQSVAVSTASKVSPAQNARIPALNRTPMQLDDYLKLLERTIDHPVVKPTCRYSTYLKHSAATLNKPLLPYDHLSSSKSLREAKPNQAIDLNIPSLAKEITAALEKEEVSLTYLTKSCHLVTSSKNCTCIAQYLDFTLQCLKKYVSRAKKLKYQANAPEYIHGLEQFGGFCKEIHSIATSALLGIKIFAATANSGFSKTLNLFKENHDALSTLLCKPFYAHFPSENSIATAQTKFQECLESILNAYDKIGRSGFFENWTDISKCNPDVISPVEMEIVVIAMIKSFACLSSASPNIVEVFRVLVHSDNVEKTYLLKHIRAFPKEDQPKVIGMIESIGHKIEDIHHIIRSIIAITETGVKHFYPPEPERQAPAQFSFRRVLSWHSNETEERLVLDRNDIPMPMEDALWLEDLAPKTPEITSPAKIQVSAENLTNTNEDDFDSHIINPVDGLMVTA